MTEMLYQTDSYLRDFHAKVVMVDEENRAVILDRTAFYPGGGGQPYDTGTLIFGDPVEGADIGAGGYSLLPALQVKRARKVGDDVVHIIEDGGEHLPQPGMAVRGRIDWERRYQIMRTHTALHILSGVVFRDYGASVTGGNMDPLSARMDFEFETMEKDLVFEIEEAANKEVDEARPVSVDILPREEAFQIPDLIRTKINLLPEGIEEVRVVNLEGLDLQADGGTHVENTKEVGRIRVVDYKSKGKINKRLYIELDESAAPEGKVEE